VFGTCVSALKNITNFSVFEEEEKKWRTWLFDVRCLYFFGKKHLFKIDLVYFLAAQPTVHCS
jgi:hypothetical protein